MKKSIIWAMIGVVLMLGLVGCPQEEAWSDGAPSEISSKYWVQDAGTILQSYYKWESDGSYKTSSNGTTWNSYDTLKIAKYRTGELETARGTNYKYTIENGHMSWGGWFEFDETADPSAQ